MSELERILAAQGTQRAADEENERRWAEYRRQREAEEALRREKILQAQRAFLIELKTLFAKHEVQIDSSSEYDGHDEYCGTRYQFYIGHDGGGIDVADLDEALKKLP